MNSIQGFLIGVVVGAFFAVLIYDYYVQYNKENIPEKSDKVENPNLEQGL